MATLASAEKAIEGALGSARELGVTVTVAVVDDGGHLVALSRMDGCPFPGAEIATAKAWTAAAFSRSTKLLEDGLGGHAGFTASAATLFGGKFSARQGGLPLPGGGAIGVSGGAPQQDEDIAHAGVVALSP